MNKLSNKFPNVFLTNTHIDLQKSGLSTQEPIKSNDKFTVIAQLVEDDYNYGLPDNEDYDDKDYDDDDEYVSDVDLYDIDLRCPHCNATAKNIEYFYKKDKKYPHLAKCSVCKSEWEPEINYHKIEERDKDMPYNEDFANTLREPKPERNRSKDTFERLEDLLSSKSNKNLSAVAQSLTGEDEDVIPDEDVRLDGVDEDIPPIGKDEDPWSNITINEFLEMSKKLKGS